MQGFLVEAIQPKFGVRFSRDEENFSIWQSLKIWIKTFQAPDKITKILNKLWQFPSGKKWALY